MLWSGYVLHHFHGKFGGIVSLHAKLVQEFKEQVPNSHNIGYYEGQKHAKMVIASNEDIEAMYVRYPSGDITLWCDGSSEDSVTTNKGTKQNHEESNSKFHEREEEVDDIYRELKEKHVDKYDGARMISSKVHESMEDPPNIPVFGGGPSKKKQRISLRSYRLCCSCHC